MATADALVSDLLGRVLDRQIARLRVERATALAPRVTEIDAELAILATELTRVTPRRPNVTVFIGDSITSGWAINTLATPVVNKGVPGHNPTEMLARFQTDVLDLYPARVHILGGANDMSLYDTPDASRILEMATLAVGAGIRTYVGTVTPGSDRPQAGVENYNAQIRAAAPALGFTVIDYYPAMTTPNYFDQSLYLDTVHPNATGYARMRTVFLKAFR